MKVKIATTLDNSIISAIALAFTEDPMFRWLYSNPKNYLKHFPSFIEAYGGKSFKQKSAFYIEGYLGAALWLPPHIEPDKENVIQCIEKVANKGQLIDAYYILEQLEQYHPTEPYWYLSFIGVDHYCQNQGHGSELMRYALSRFDSQSSAAYLESSNPRNITFYERHGFKKLGKIQKGSTPALYPMLRSPVK